MLLCKTVTILLLLKHMWESKMENTSLLPPLRREYPLGKPLCNPGQNLEGGHLLTTGYHATDRIHLFREETGLLFLSSPPMKSGSHEVIACNVHQDGPWSLVTASYKEWAALQLLEAHLRVLLLGSPTGTLATVWHSAQCSMGKMVPPQVPDHPVCPKWGTTLFLLTPFIQTGDQLSQDRGQSWDEKLGFFPRETF